MLYVYIISLFLFLLLLFIIIVVYIYTYCSVNAVFFVSSLEQNPMYTCMTSTPVRWVCDHALAAIDTLEKLIVQWWGIWGIRSDCSIVTEEWRPTRRLIGLSREWGRPRYCSCTSSAAEHEARCVTQYKYRSLVYRRRTMTSL